MPATDDLAEAIGIERPGTPSTALRVAPRQYVNERGAVDRIEPYLRDREGDSVVVLASERGYASVGEDLEAAIEGAGGDYGVRSFGGECSVAEVSRHRRALDESPALVVGVGGGKVIDTAKLVAEGICPVVTVPTSAATSAAWAALSVVYDEDGHYRGGVALSGCPDALLLDPAVAAAAPARYLASGIMDASAKFFETALIDDEELGPLASLGRRVAREVYAEPLGRYAETAVADAHSDAVTPALEAAVEAAVAGPAVAAGLLSDRTYLTLPHVLCYTLLSYGTVQEDSLHGERVAYGALTLQALLGRSSADLRALKRWYEALGQPMALTDLGVETTGQTVERIGRDAHDRLEHNLLARSVTPEDVVAAIETVETLPPTTDS